MSGENRGCVGVSGACANRPAAIVCVGRSVRQLRGKYGLATSDRLPTFGKGA